MNATRHRTTTTRAARWLAIAALACGCAAQAQVADREPPPKDARDRADALLDDDLLSEQPAWNGLHGFYQFEGAYTLPSPSHWSKLRNRLELGSQGQFSESVKWKVSGRADYDAIYSLSDFYPPTVRKDQRFEAQFRETYLDIAAGNLEFRLGRQQIVWGEVVGLFFADVVSAKDLRETVLEDFDLLRIPQWASRAEYFMGDTHFEAIWIPVPTVDEIGKPGSAFFAYPPAAPAGYGYFINDERKPKHNGTNQNFGLRVSTLVNGWDGALFAYRSVDTSPTYLRAIVNTPTPTFVYTPVHEKVTQYGATIVEGPRRPGHQGRSGLCGRPRIQRLAIERCRRRGRPALPRLHRELRVRAARRCAPELPALPALLHRSRSGHHSAQGRERRDAVPVREVRPFLAAGPRDPQPQSQRLDAASEGGLELRQELAGGRGRSTISAASRPACSVSSISRTAPTSRCVAASRVGFVGGVSMPRARRIEA